MRSLVPDVRRTCDGSTKHTNGGIEMTNEPDEQHDNWRTAPEEHTTNEPLQQEAEWELAIQVPYDETEKLATTIIYAVAETEGVGPQDIESPPLYDVVDTEALEATHFGTGWAMSRRDSRCSTEFTYRGLRIVVRSSGWILVYERADG